MDNTKEWLITTTLKYGRPIYKGWINRVFRDEAIVFASTGYIRLCQDEDDLTVSVRVEDYFLDRKKRKVYILVKNFFIGQKPSRDFIMLSTSSNISADELEGMLNDWSV